MDLYREDVNGCWVWRRPLNQGYGSLYDGRTGHCRAAHRVIYERETGRRVSPDLHLHHLCGNKACVNPAHLQPVANNEHGAGIEVRAIRYLAEHGVSCELLADAFGWTEGRVEIALGRK